MNENCVICGADRATPFPDHDQAKHEVFALNNWGIDSVRLEAKAHVEGWASGAVPMPTNEEYNALRQQWLETRVGQQVAANIALLKEEF